jgi:hypothetical protein
VVVHNKLKNITIYHVIIFSNKLKIITWKIEINKGLVIENRSNNIEKQGEEGKENPQDCQLNLFRVLLVLNYWLWKNILTLRW